MSPPHIQGYAATSRRLGRLCQARLGFYVGAAKGVEETGSFGDAEDLLGVFIRPIAIHKNMCFHRLRNAGLADSARRAAG